jgi:hypothetical protein
MPRFAKCHFCGGANRGVSGPGRYKSYRGVRCELPADLEIDTCTSCGREWMSDEQIDIMSDAFERQRLAAKRGIVEQWLGIAGAESRAASQSVETHWTFRQPVSRVSLHSALRSFGGEGLVEQPAVCGAA